MSNALTSVTTDLSVFGNLVLEQLQPRLVMLRRITVGVPVPATYGDEIQISDISVSGNAGTRAVGGAATASDLVALTRTITKTNIYKAVKLDNLEIFFSNIGLMERAARQIARAVAREVDAVILRLVDTDVPYEVGQLDGSSCMDEAQKYLSLAYKQLMKNGADVESLFCVLGDSEAHNFRQNSNLYKVNEAGSSDLLRRAILGSVLGFEIVESQQVVSSTLSTNAATTGTASVSAASLGASSISAASLGTGTIKKGTTFTISTVNNALGNSIGFVVTADATITANAATLPIYPSLPVALAGTETLTFVDHSAAGSMNLAWDRDSILGYVAAPAPFPEGTGVASTTVTDEQSGLSIRIAAKSNLLGSAGNAYNTELGADVMFGAKVIRPEGTVKITGEV
ncbi:MAG TPA: hypothetical protein PLB01_00270 [Thermoanaerobaculia bacterium]|nr:hypothetical protein [Thermoanaerobaculia bacterium]